MAKGNKQNNQKRQAATTETTTVDTNKGMSAGKSGGTKKQSGKKGK